MSDITDKIVDEFVDQLKRGWLPTNKNGVVGWTDDYGNFIDEDQLKTVADGYKQIISDAVAKAKGSEP